MLSHVTLPHPVSVCAAVVAATLAAFLYFRLDYILASRKFAKSHGIKAPRLWRHWDPFLGLDFVVHTAKIGAEKRTLAHLQECFQRFGSTYMTRALGDRLIFTDEPKNVQAILATQFPDFAMGERRRTATAELIGHGVFNADGEYWQHSRAMLKPNFIRTQVADLSLFEIHIQKMISLLQATKERVDIQQLFFRMTLDTASHFLFGKSVGSLDPNATSESMRFAKAFDQTLVVIAMKFRLHRFSRLHGGRAFKEACKIVHEYADPIIEQAVQAQHLKDKADHTQVNAEKPQEEDNERYIFLHELVKQTDNKTELRNQVTGILIAGRDSTASLLSSSMFVLARRPDIWAKLQSSLAHLKGRAPNYEELKEIKYLRWILQETLRLYPVVPVNLRFASKDTTLPCGGGPDGSSPMFVPEGTMCIWIVYSMHRRPDLWGEDAAEFKPERWDSLAPGFNFLPFNAGPRICLGQQFALTEASYTIIRLCQAFKSIKALPEEMDMPWIERLNLTCAISDNVNVQCVPR